MDFAEDNIFKTSLIQEIKGISSSTAQIAKEIAVSDEYLNSLSQSSFALLSNNQQFKENPLDQIKTIKSILSKIRNTSIRINRLIESTNLQSLNLLEKNEINHQINEIITTLNIVKEKQYNFNKAHLIKLTNIEEALENSRSITISHEMKIKVSLIINQSNVIIDSLNYTYQVLESTKESIIRQQENLVNKSNLNYINKFKEDTDLIIKKYENEIINLTEKFENQFKKFELNQTKVTKSSELLSTAVDAGLKNLGELNERTQNIELEFSKIIGAETQKVKNDLNESKNNLMKFSDSIKKEAVNSLNEINDEANQKLAEISIEADTKLDSLNTAHTDFINLVSNAGIYKLTENYDKKATEEKKQYETYRTYTSRAIGAAIVFTVIILTIPLIEYWGAVPAVDTNYYTILARLTISLMFFVLALYFSKQASKHYECYQDNHRTFLQLAALEPFMANMTPEEKQEIRKSLVPSYFNQGSESKFATKGDDVDMSMMFTFMDKLSNFGQNKKETKAAESTATDTKPVV